MRILWRMYPYIGQEHAYFVENVSIYWTEACVFCGESIYIPLHLLVLE